MPVPNALEIASFAAKRTATNGRGNFVQQAISDLVRQEQRLRKRSPKRSSEPCTRATSMMSMPDAENHDCEPLHQREHFLDGGGQPGEHRAADNAVADVQFHQDAARGG